MSEIAKTPEDDLAIRAARLEDAAAIRELLYAGADEFIVHEFSPESRQHYLNQLTTAKIAEKMGGDFRFYIAVISDNIAGVAALRGNNHLYYLFVAKPFHRRGIAKRLWEHIRADAVQRGNRGAITVNASNFAVAAYERLGFVRTSSATDTNGVRCNPMAFHGSRNDGATAHPDV